MRAWQVATLGAEFSLREVPSMRPAQGEVCLQVKCCGLNFADLLMRDGKYQEKPALPYTPGMEVAGVVEALGPGVTGLAPGMRVLAFVNSGGLAERVVVPADRLLVLPDTMPFADAAAFPIAYGTSHLALDHKARLQPGVPPQEARVGDRAAAHHGVDGGDPVAVVAEGARDAVGDGARTVFVQGSALGWGHGSVTRWLAQAAMESLSGTARRRSNAQAMSCSMATCAAGASRSTRACRMRSCRARSGPWARCINSRDALR